jgi:hypothetical protein
MAQFGSIAANLDALLGISPERCKVSRIADKVFANDAGLQGANAWLTFETDAATESYKSVSGMHSMSSNTQRLVATYAGIYFVEAVVTFGLNATGSRIVYMDHNTTQVVNVGRNAENGVWTYVNFQTHVLAVENDYFSLRCAQNSGGNLEVVANVSWFSIRRVSGELSI